MNRRQLIAWTIVALYAVLVVFRLSRSWPDPTNMLAVTVLYVGVPLNALVTVMLWRRSRAAPDIRVLRERFIVAAFVLLLVLVFGLIFLNNDRLPPVLTTDLTKLITRSVTLGIAIVPALYWLRLYRNGGEDDDGA